jgi:hypothetical protein
VLVLVPVVGAEEEPDDLPPVSLGMPLPADISFTPPTAALGAPVAVLPETAPAPPMPAITTADSVPPQVMQVFAPALRPRFAARFWARSQLGFFWLSGMHLPPLVTSSPAGTPIGTAGVLGAPTTLVLSDPNVNGSTRTSGQFALGFWLDEDRIWGLESNFLVIGGQQQRYAVGSNGTQIIARPFIDATTGTGAVELISFPGVRAGTVAVDAHSDPLYSVNALIRGNLYRDCTCEVSALAGYRFLRLDEDLRIRDDFTALTPPGATSLVTDQFATHNTFNGGELGLQTNFARGRWSLEVLSTLSVGNLRRSVSINGSTEVTVPGFAPVSGPGGLLALPSNIGQYSSDRVVVIPELGITAGWQLTRRLRATLGYSLLWWPSLVRPGEQIDLVVNPNQLPPAVPGGPARPAFILNDTNLWVQGVRVGLEYRY